MTNLAIDITSLVVSILLMEHILSTQMCNLIIHNWQITKHQPFQGLPSHMEIFGCNNLVLYKVATRLKIPWICNVFYLVATLLTGCKHLVTTLK